MTVAVTAEDVERTGRTVTSAQWGVAAVVMVGSAASAGIGFDALHEHWAIGVITGLGVDLALAGALVIGRRLRAVGVTTCWSHVLTWLTGVMTLALNSGAAVIQDRYVLAVAHAFLPILLIALCEFGSAAQLKLLQVRRDAETAEQAARDTRLAADQARDNARQRAQRELERHRANGELIDAQDVLVRAQELRQQAEQERELARQERAATEDEITAAKTAAQQLAKLRRPMQPTKAGTATREERRQWVRDERAAGRNPTGAQVNKRFGPPRTGATIVAEVQREIDAELATLTTTGASR